MIELKPNQQEAYDTLIQSTNEMLPCEVECNALIADIDSLMDQMKVKHYQLNDIVYHYDISKNSIEKIRIASIWLQPDGNIIYNSMYYSCDLKNSLEECKAYASILLKQKYEEALDKIKKV